MMLESVFACVSVNQTLPSESRAAIMDNLGLTDLSSTFVVPSLRAHVLRVWLDSFNQVSSMLMILFSFSWIYISFNANCCRRTNDRSEFDWGLNFLVLRKLRLNSFFKTRRTTLELRLRPDIYCASDRITSALVMALPSFWKVSTTCSTDSIRFYSSCYRSFSALSLSGFFLDSVTSSLTSCVVILNFLATSLWGMYCFVYEFTIPSCSTTDNWLRCLGL
jgi:hypothetical protein